MKTTKRIIKAGFVNFWRNKAVAVASVFVMTVTLFVIGALMLSADFLEGTLDNIKNRVDISVTFQTDSTEDSILALKKSIEQLPEVKSVTYSSAEDELEAFQTRHADNALLIQSLEEVGNPFGARLSILAKDPSQYETVAKFLDNYNQTDGQNIVDQISFKKDIIDKLLSVISASRKVGFIISILLVIMAVLVTFNTISLTIYTARDEISVMRLVGASNTYVSGPFVVEGILSGVIATFLAMILLYPMSLWVRNTTLSVYGGIDMVAYYISDFGRVFLSLLVSGVVLGIISSFLATRKYLKV
jgi:cell division transport system permease protein